MRAPHPNNFPCSAPGSLARPAALKVISLGGISTRARPANRSPTVNSCSRGWVVPQPGDLLAVLHAGAYGFAMSSNYNGHLRPAEVLIEGDTFRVIRRRQTVDDLLAGTEM